MHELPFSKSASYISVKECAVFLGMNTKTIRRWITSGKLPATKPGHDWRIAKSDLKALLAARGNGTLDHVP
ncbi:helix-turn-helix domain-containing protein [Lutimaribacter saemankumensis]|uniref:DNA binding domain-containing protein, excisionase family n=1 Tax=Lutimaribacter saemankumensis TaxID=490829 RepID=A0A1G8T858_9RHOB|nr:helix-turn-helix domain-containing protein [Lutimaribacter saemankumensis]SDJ37611.1 DNA binding domain-containing protein, excisionase family [Lutimaribacter saemankumensis]